MLEPDHRAGDAAPPVVLRPMTADDVARVVEWEQHPGNAAFVEAWPAERHLQALRDPGFRTFVLVSAQRDVGFVMLAGISGRSPDVELKRLVVAEKGRGIGTATVSLVLRYVFEQLGAARVWLDFVDGNTRAHHLYEAQGFRVEPAAATWANIGGVRVPLVTMTLSRSEFERRGR